MFYDIYFLALTKLLIEYRVSLYTLGFEEAYEDGVDAAYDLAFEYGLFSSYGDNNDIANELASNLVYDCEYDDFAIPFNSKINLANKFSYIDSVWGGGRSRYNAEREDYFNFASYELPNLPFSKYYLRLGYNAGYDAGYSAQYESSLLEGFLARLPDRVFTESR